MGTGRPSSLGERERSICLSLNCRRQLKFHPPAEKHLMKVQSSRGGGEGTLLLPERPGSVREPRLKSRNSGSDPSSYWGCGWKQAAGSLSWERRTLGVAVRAHLSQPRGVLRLLAGGLLLPWTYGGTVRTAAMCTNRQSPHLPLRLRLSVTLAKRPSWTPRK